MKRGIFREILILYAITALVSILGLGFYLDVVVSNHYLDELNENLSVKASLVGSLLQGIPGAGLEAVTKESRRLTGARITVIAADGTVLSDSHSDPRLMDDHGQRPEIQEAFTSRTGSAARQSATVGSDLLYVAQRVDLDPEPVVVRLAVPLSDVKAAIFRLKSRILFAVTLVFVAGGAFAAYQTRRIKRVAGKIAEFSGRIASGALDSQLHFQGFEEFDRIADHLNTMAIELKGMIGKLSDEAERLNLILEGIPHALLILDPQGTIVLSSKVSDDFFDTAPLIGKPVDTVVKSDRFKNLFTSVKQDHASVDEEIQVAVPRPRYWSVRISPFHEGGDVGGYIAIFNDITQMVKLEQVRKDFVANASHEIKTPITAIRGFADTLLDGALDDREHATRFLETIRAHSERINRLVDDLMTISKIELGVIAIDKQDFDLQELAENVIATLEERARAKGISIHTWFRHDTRNICADRHRVFQILANLVDNAVKFTETGSITIGTGVEEGRRYFYVRDTGIGIPQEHLPRIGERFYRVDPSRSRELGGTGLGLAIVKHLVKAHGWEWSVDSAPGKGTRVRIFLSASGDGRVPEVHEKVLLPPQA